MSKRTEYYAGLASIFVGAIALVVIGIFGYSNFNVSPMPATGLKDEPCTLDSAIAGYEVAIQRNQEELDRMLQDYYATVYIEPEVVLVEERDVKIESESDEPEHFIPDPALVTQPVTELSVDETVVEIEESVSESVVETIVESVEETVPQSAIYQPVDSMMSPDLQAWVYAYCTQQGVDPYIIMAICERESCCIANIYGDNGKAYGIMQVQVRWVQDKLRAHGFTNEDMLYAQDNIVIGTEILQDHLARGNGMRWALMAYNGGVQQAGSPATQEYADWVLNRAEELRQ